MFSVNFFTNLRKPAALLITLFLLLLAAQSVSASDGLAEKQHVYAFPGGSSEISLDVAPEIVNGTVMVPLRTVVENLGGRIEADGNNKITIYKNGKAVFLQSNPDTGELMNIVQTEDGVKSSEIPAVCREGRILAGIKALAELIGCTTDWYGHGMEASVLDYGKVLVFNIGSCTARKVERGNESLLRHTALFLDNKSRTKIHEAIEGQKEGSLLPGIDAMSDEETYATVIFGGTLAWKYTDTGLKKSLYKSRIKGMNINSDSLVVLSEAFTIVLDTAGAKSAVIKLANGNELSAASDKKIFVDPDKMQLKLESGEKYDFDLGKWEMQKYLMTDERKENIRLALKYYAGGCYMNPEQLYLPVEKTDTGAVICYTMWNQDEERELISKIKKDLHSGDVIFCWDGCAYVFGSGSRKSFESLPDMLYVSMYDRNCEKHVIYDKDVYGAGDMPKRTSYFPDIYFDSSLGLCLGDEFKTTYKYDRFKDMFIELQEYIMHGTPKARVTRALELLCESGGMEDIKKEDIELYKKTGVDDDCVSFKVLKDSGGSPAYFVVCGGKGGLDGGYLKSVFAANSWLNKYDPPFVRLMSDRYGLYCVTLKLTGIKTEKNGSDNFCRLGFVGILSIDSQFEKRTVAEAGDYLPLLLVSGARGLYNTAHEFQCGGKKTLCTKDKILETDSAELEREAYKFRWTETMNRESIFFQFDINRDIPLEMVNGGMHKRISYYQYYEWMNSSITGYNFYRKEIDAFPEIK